MKYDVCCLGHLCTDVLVKPVDGLPESGKLKYVDTVNMASGGCSMNTAIGLAKLGVNTAFVGKAGDDSFGSFLEAALTEMNVDTSGFIRHADCKTPVSIVCISTSGERSMLYTGGQNSVPALADINLSIVKESRYLFIGGIFLLPGFAGELSREVLKEAQQSGVITAMDTAWDASGMWLATIKSNLPYIDWFMPSIEEAQEMMGTADPVQLAKSFKQLGVKNVVIKMGNKGCYVEAQDQEGLFIHPFSVAVVDTAGAGDSWCAGFLAGMLNNMSISNAAIFGNAVAACCITKIGTTAGILDFCATQDFVADNTGYYSQITQNEKENADETLTDQSKNKVGHRFPEKDEL